GKIRSVASFSPKYSDGGIEQTMRCACVFAVLVSLFFIPGLRVSGLWRKAGDEKQRNENGENTGATHGLFDASV
ncbi:MAG: hypothetical protein AAGF59_15120, partial [Pseudomonadota bacterium]